MRHTATLGMVALVGAALCGFVAGTAQAATHVVEVTDHGLTPANLIILRGDVVRWEWESGNHMLRNGESPDDPEAGEIWEFPLNAGSRSFELVFDLPGSYEYYSSPYFNQGVKGVIEVKESTDAAPQTWSRLKKLFVNTRPDLPL